MNDSQSLHPTDQTLRTYGLGMLDDIAATMVDKHLGSCCDCRQRVAEVAPGLVLGQHRDARRPAVSSGPLMSSTAGLSILGAGAAGSPAQLPASMLPPGLADHSDYEIIRELGRGGMGVVYLVQNTLLVRPEVLKVVASHLINRHGALDRFLVEIRNSAMLQHPNIVTAYSARRIGECLVLAMEYVEGLDLAKMVEARGPLPVAHACNYVHQAALGLQHAHEHGMVHRDIKPSNLMLARESDRAVIKVLDFGLAKVRSNVAVDGGLTHEGQMLGTPAYIAPEQITNARRADIRADIYSLGCTLYCLLTGGPPFRGTSLHDVLQAHLLTEATPLNLKRAEAPVELAALVAKMMAKTPNRRFQEPKEVAQALTSFFKKGNLPFQGTEAEVSLAGQSSSGRPVPGRISAPGQLITNDAGPVPRMKRAAWPSAQATDVKSPIDLREPERARSETPVVAVTMRRSWLWPTLAGGTMLLVLLVAWTVVVVKRELQPATASSLKERPTPPPALRSTTTVRDRPTGPDFVPNLTHSPAKPAAESLFNGSDLSGWEFVEGDDRMWYVENHILVAIVPDSRGQDTKRRSRLLTERTFKDFIFRFEYQVLLDFGFAVVWWALPGELPPLFRPFGSTLGLHTNSRGQRVFSEANAGASELKGGNGWNVVEVEARDRLLRISVNGKEIDRRVLHEKPAEPAALKTTKPAGQFPRAGMDRRSGRIGFEVNRGTGRFRNIEIEELPPSPAVER